MVFFEMIALTKEGEVYAFGENNHGQLGLGHYNDASSPTKIDVFKGTCITHISAGMEHAGAVTGILRGVK